jgi:hypothetical protein
MATRTNFSRVIPGRGAKPAKPNRYPLPVVIDSGSRRVRGLGRNDDLKGLA